jgi:predicted phosphodiesterase
VISFNNLIQVAQKDYSQRDFPSAVFLEINPTKNHFIIVGDTQSTSSWEFWRERNSAEQKLIAEEISRREPAFVVHLGDLTTRGSSRKHWGEFDALYGAFPKRKIFHFPVLGNHDLYGNNTKALQYYFDRFPHLQGRRWYSFIWKNIGLIFLDSNFSSLTMEEKESQEKWYIGELERFEKAPIVEHIIVCCHESPFTNSRVIRPNKKVEACFADHFVQFRKASFFFSGHCHSYERFQMEGKFFVVSGGGGGPRHKLFTSPEGGHYRDLFKGPELRFFHFIEMEKSHAGLNSKVLRLEADGRFSILDPLSIPNTAASSSNR